MRLFHVFILACLSLSFTVPLTAQAQVAPISGDQRIRTLIYSPDSVFSLTTYYGYQSNIVFADNEQITTISVGNQTNFQLVPAKNYLFIRPMVRDGRTNMTVLTNKRSYQFDLISKAPSNDKSVAYVTRFFYPETATAQANTQPVTAAPPLTELPPFPASPAMPAMEAAAPVAPTAIANTNSPYPHYNFSYAVSGDDAIAPTQVFDDGQNTYFTFLPTANPQLYIVDPDGSERPVQLSMTKGYLSTPTVANRFSIRSGNQVVCVFRETEPVAAGGY